MPAVAIGFLSILALALFYMQCKLDSALAPLASLGTAVSVLLCFGVLGALPLGAIFFLVASFLLGVYSFVKMGYKAVWNAVKTVGFLVFFAFGVAALLWFGVREPLFSQWDEFSFWGTVVKMMKLQGELYTMAEAGWFWTATEMPALPLLGWFVQFLSGDFLPWAVYFADALVIFACASALTACAQKNLYAALSLAAGGLLLPFIFLSPERITALSPAYLIAYGDLPAGLCFGGAMAFYLCVRRTGRIYWALLPLAMLALMKDNTFAISLVAGGLMLCDALFILPREEDLRVAPKKRWCWLFLAVPALSYVFWRVHTGFANAQNVVTQGEATGASATSALQSSVLQLFGLQPRSEAMQTTLVNMMESFTNNVSVSMLGTALQNAVFIWVLFAFALLFARGRLQRIQVLLWSVLSTMGFFGFQFVLLTYYAFLNSYGGGIPDYTRYQKSYFAGWLMLAACQVALCAVQKEELCRFRQKAKGLAAQSLAVFLGFGSLCLFGLNILDGYSVLDYPNSRYDLLYAEQYEAQDIAEQIEPGSRTFYVNQNDTGLGWFKTHYYIMPHILDYSYGGGRIVPEEEGGRGEIVLSPEALLAYLEEQNCTYIYIDEIDGAFVQQYGALFSDHLRGVNDEPMLYHKGEDGHYWPVDAGDTPEA